MNASGNVCTGCFRTIEEIENWLKYTDEERAYIIELLAKRKTNRRII